MLTENIQQNPIGTTPALLKGWPSSGSRNKRECQTMFATFDVARQTAVSLAGAFITALLFVSAAVGPLPIA